MPIGKIISLTVACFFTIQVFAQQPVIELRESGRKISLRGLSVVSDEVIWASGSRGSVARSTDGGKNFQWITVPGYEKNDFRDIEAFDANTAVIMGITEPAVILKTTDGGQNWRKVFEDTTKGAFLDAMDFADSRHGVVAGDPTHGSLYTVFTHDGGDSWQISDWTSGKDNKFLMKEGEAFFASSGTNIHLLPDGKRFVFASGGKSSRFFNGSRFDSLPIMQGGTSTGANSIAVYGAAKAMVVGGDFGKDTIARSNAVLIDFSGKNNRYTLPQTPPHGYRSCVIYLDAQQLITCGTSGVDISRDSGNNWELISKESYHVVQKAKKGNAVFLAGANGRIARLIFP
jgi:photosystem II stability/assembly factor-like uncharacterized protein